MSADRAIVYQLDLLRVDVHLRAQVLELLKRMEKELIAQVADGVTDWGKARISQQLAEATSIIRKYYDEAAGVAIDTTTSIYQISATEAARSLALASAEIVPALLPPLAMMERIAGNTVVQGATQGAWWARQSGDAAWRFSTAVRQGLVAAENNQQITNRVKVELGITQSNAAALVQTSVQTVANEARFDTFKQNSDVLKGVQYLATLDNLTCTVCGPRDGMTWTLEGKPIKATLPLRRPPLHFNCRCVLIPLTRFTGLGDDERASMDGPVSGKVTFTEFLKSKGPEFQDDVLGKGRAQLYRDGKITLQDLVTSNNRPLTLAQLRAKYG